jgi:acetyl esterase/lipase
MVPWADKILTYNGDGELICYMSADDPLFPSGESVTKEDPLYSRILGEDRPLIVYLPSGYEADRVEPYPVVFVLHGFGSRGQNMASMLIEPVEKAIASGDMPDSVLVFVDFSVSGDSSDDPDTFYDERGGTFYINSNLGRFEDHFFEEIATFVFSNFNVRTDPEGVAMIGSSMGGFGVLYYAITHPSFSHILVPVYPVADLRYGIDGDKMADYDPDGYAPIDTDDPRRIVDDAPVFGLLGVTEEWIYYNVFDSDKVPGEVWAVDLPVWERMMQSNPVEILAADRTDLSDQRYYIIVGSNDDFNFNSHIPILVPLLTEAGAQVFPEKNVIPGGFHGESWMRSQLDEIIRWLGSELK